MIAKSSFRSGPDRIILLRSETNHMASAVGSEFIFVLYFWYPWLARLPLLSRSGGNSISFFRMVERNETATGPIASG